MGANNGGIDHRIFIVSIGGQMLEQLLPYITALPAAEARMNHAKIAKTLRQVAPRNTGAIAE